MSRGRAASQVLGPFIERGPVRKVGWSRIHPEEIVSQVPRMNMEVEVWYLLVRSCTRRVPDTQPVIGKNVVDQTGDTCHRAHERGGSHVIDLANVRKMTTGNDENVSRVILPDIHEGQCERVRDDDARWYPAFGNAAKDTFVAFAV